MSTQGLHASRRERAQREGPGSLIDPITARYRTRELRRCFRGEAAFAHPAIYEYLEAERFSYAIRLPANDILFSEIGHRLTRLAVRPPKASVVLYHDFRYQAAGWSHKRRVIAKVE